VLGFSGLTTAAVLLMRTVAQSLHAQPVHSDREVGDRDLERWP
jgi:hypothetical protein